jgi:hypothetical protein
MCLLWLGGTLENLTPWLMVKDLLFSRVVRQPKQFLTDGMMIFERLRYKPLWSSLVPSERANHAICQLLKSGRPGLVSRIGNTEGRIVGEFLYRGRHYSRLSKRQCHQNAGIFPVDICLLNRFSEIYADALRSVDCLGFWQTPYQARWIASLEQPPLLAPLSSLEPYFHADPWTAALAGKRVLVVHPFAQSIASQYRYKRQMLFANPKLLPEFDLEVLAPPQTLAPSTAGYADWVEALNDLVRQVSERNFDVALLGCGAYGLPLGAAIKRDGRQAIHLGGSLQLMFGIRGRRWDDMASFQHFFNDAWVRPSAAETPQSANSVDAGCYW